MRSARDSHGIPTGLPHLALSVPEGSLPLLPPLRLLRQSLITYLRDTVQNPYLLHPHTYDVPFATLRERHLGVLSRKETIPNSQKFTNNEEQVLLQKVLQLSADGFLPQRAIVEEMANTMLQTKNPAHSQRVGTKWVANFVKRHPELLSVYNRKFDIQRAEVEDPKLISLWFKLVGDTIAKYGVAEEDVFNFDETGF
jgi:hypothetical protein